MRKGCLVSTRDRLCQGVKKIQISEMWLTRVREWCATKISNWSLPSFDMKLYSVLKPLQEPCGQATVKCFKNKSLGSVHAHSASQLAKIASLSSESVSRSTQFASRFLSGSQAVISPNQPACSPNQIASSPGQTFWRFTGLIGLFTGLNGWLTHRACWLVKTLETPKR